MLSDQCRQPNAKLVGTFPGAPEHGGFVIHSLEPNQINSRELSHQASRGHAYEAPSQRLPQASHIDPGARPSSAGVFVWLTRGIG